MSLKHSIWFSNKTNANRENQQKECGFVATKSNIKSQPINLMVFFYYSHNLFLVITVNQSIPFYK